ncbi:MAG: hypothetical protein Q9221_009009 [Calogaya cf. arnoldii]
MASSITSPLPLTEPLAMSPSYRYVCLRSAPQLISLEPLLNPDTPAAQEASKALLSAFRTSGFLYLTDYHSLIPPFNLSTVFQSSATFFARSQALKDSVASRSASSNRGYIRPGREKPSHLDSDGEAFKNVMQDFFLRYKELYTILIRGIAIGLGLEVSFLDKLVDKGDNNLRLLHYPAVGREAFKGALARWSNDLTRSTKYRIV